MAAERGLELVRELHRAAGGHLPPFRVSSGNSGMGSAARPLPLTVRAVADGRDAAGAGGDAGAVRAEPGGRVSWAPAEHGRCCPAPALLLRFYLLPLIPQVRSEVGTDGPDFPHPVPALLPAPEPALPAGLPVSVAGGGRLPWAHPCRHRVPRDRVLGLSARAGGFSTSSEVAVGLVLLVFFAAVTTKRRHCFLLLFKV